MSEPNLNIFEALKQLGVKLPFRFPMVDWLLPTISFGDISGLVPVPIEPRGISGGQENVLNAAAEQAYYYFKSLAPGGSVIDFLSLRLDTSTDPEDAEWRVSIGDSSGRLPSQEINFDLLTKLDVGGAPTGSRFHVTDLPLGAFEIAELVPGAVMRSGLLEFKSPAQIFVPPGKYLRFWGHRNTATDVATAINLSWREFPATLEEP